MDAIKKELESRKNEIKKEVKFLFKANMKFTDWDVPEADDEEVARILLDIIQEALDEIKQDIDDGKYKNY
ncbi:MAG: hypothetical protein GXO60_01055 [Epsilonproteobacteria bacterium]|nr:hypothetical protein [Campylobacterota bacterium]